MMLSSPDIKNEDNLWDLIRRLKFVVTAYGDVRASVWLCGVHTVGLRSWASKWTPNLSWTDNTGERYYLAWEDKGSDEPVVECSMPMCNRSGTEEFHFGLSGSPSVCNV